LAQFSGSWSATIDVLTPELVSSTLTLTYTISGWTLTSVSGFDNSGFADQDFSVSGTLGAISLDGSMAFNVSKAEYESSSISASLDFAGVAFDFSVEHVAYPYKDPWPCEQTKSYMVYTLGASADNFGLTAKFEDCCTGIVFKDIKVTLSDLSLCCGLTYGVEFYFTKAGFDYITFSISPLFEICCGISLGIDVKFTEDGKAVTPTFSWEGLTGCVTVWGDVTTATDDDALINGLEIYGYKIYCELAECNYLEIVTAFDPSIVNSYIADDFEGSEYQYIKLGFCGPACCGGSWTVDAIAFFQETGSLFGLTRFGVDASVPVIGDTLVLNIAFTSKTTLTIGWTFTF